LNSMAHVCPKCGAKPHQACRMDRLRGGGFVTEEDVLAGREVRTHYVGEWVHHQRISAALDARDAVVKHRA